VKMWKMTYFEPNSQHESAHSLDGHMGLGPVGGWVEVAAATAAAYYWVGASGFLVNR
jgi:hypothetical protein